MPDNVPVQNPKIDWNWFFKQNGFFSENWLAHQGSKQMINSVLWVFSLPVW